MKTLPVWKPSFRPDKPFSAIVSASRESGKSYLVRHFLKSILVQNFDVFVVFCGSPTQLDEYKEILPGSLFFDEFRPEVISSIEASQNKRHAENKPMLRVLMIMDDCVGYKEKNSDEIMQSYTRGRHINTSIIFITQNITLCNTHWRTNSDYLFILKNNAASAKNFLAKELLDGIEDEDILMEYVPENKTTSQKMYLYLLNKYAKVKGDCLVVDITDDENKIFQYRAPEVQAYNYHMPNGKNKNDYDPDESSDEDIEIKVSPVDEKTAVVEYDGPQPLFCSIL